MGSDTTGAIAITVTEKLQQQKRFFCENCKREVFLTNKFCDRCGGEIQWPDQVRKILDAWIKEKKGKRRLLNRPSIFRRQKE
ncbi:MAG TPA: zinc-ribbon domain-containing protein [Candidatus Dormibacteraeota bacterium]|jgi:predicted amidophosphoribosyltransferase|nr:zinc-ribbon domain-containing protein [Candidatus Dormibacteraeota bacterium]